MPIADRIVEAGRLGQKTGKGWYRYEPGDRTPHPAPRSQGRNPQMTRQELDQALARLGLDVPAKERDEIAAATPLLEDVQKRLRPPGGRDVAAEPSHVVRFPEG